MPEKNITFEIKEHLGVITRFESGWCRELNIISWNGAAAKYDIRDWDPHHERMKKGVTLYEGEMRKLVDLYLNNNSQKAVEAGRALEEQRRLRQQEQRTAAADRSRREAANSAEDDTDKFEEAAESDSFEGALPPETEVPEGAELEKQEAPQSRESLPQVEAQPKAEEAAEGTPF